MRTKNNISEKDKFIKTYDPQIRFSSIIVQKWYDEAHRMHLDKMKGIKHPRKYKHKAWEAMSEGEAKEQAFEDLIKERTIELS